MRNKTLQSNPSEATTQKRTDKRKGVSYADFQQAGTIRTAAEARRNYAAYRAITKDHQKNFAEIDRLFEELKQLSPTDKEYEQIMKRIDYLLSKRRGIYAKIRVWLGLLLSEMWHGALGIILLNIRIFAIIIANILFFVGLVALLMYWASPDA